MVFAAVDFSETDSTTNAKISESYMVKEIPSNAFTVNLEFTWKCCFKFRTSRIGSAITTILLLQSDNVILGNIGNRGVVLTHLRKHFLSSLAHRKSWAVSTGCIIHFYHLVYLMDSSYQIPQYGYNRLLRKNNQLSNKLHFSGRHFIKNYLYFFFLPQFVFLH